MYVCVCNSVTETDIKNAVDNGANCLNHLKNELKCSTQCGSCQDRAKACLESALESQTSLGDITFA